MQLLSVNVARPRLVQAAGRTISTAIFKQPVTGPVAVRRLGLEGDDQADKRVHGGPDKAVYAYAEEDYQWWQQQLGGRELPPGQFGENLTLSRVDDRRVCIGDVLRIGTAVLQVTQPRQPCMKLGVKMGVPEFVKQFHQAGRTGFYLRVIEEGSLAAGDVVELVRKAPLQMSVAEIYRLRFARPEARDEFRRAASLADLSDSWRDAFQQKLQAASDR